MFGTRKICLPTAVLPADAEKMARNCVIPYKPKAGMHPDIQEIALLILNTSFVPSASKPGGMYAYYTSPYFLNLFAIIQWNLNTPIQAGQQERSIYGPQSATGYGSQMTRRLELLLKIRTSVLPGAPIKPTPTNMLSPRMKRRKLNHTPCHTAACKAHGVVRVGAIFMCRECFDDVGKPVKYAKRALYGAVYQAASNHTAGVASPTPSVFAQLAGTSSAELRAYILCGRPMLPSKIQRERFGSMVMTNPALLFTFQLLLSASKLVATALAFPDMVVSNALVDAITTRVTFDLRCKNRPLSFAAARLFVISARVNDPTESGYAVWAVSGKRPPTIPVHPDKCYGTQWCGWEHFMRANAAVSSSSFGTTQRDFNSYTRLMFTGPANSGTIQTVADYGIVSCTGALSTASNVFSQYVPTSVSSLTAVGSVWPSPRSVFYLTMHERKRYIICPRMDIVTSCIFENLLVINLILDTNPGHVDGENDPRLFPCGRRIMGVGSAADPVRIQQAQYITWGYLYELLRLYRVILPNGPLHVTMRGDPFVDSASVHTVRTGQCWISLLQHVGLTNDVTRVRCAERVRCKQTERDKILMWMEDTTVLQPVCIQPGLSVHTFLDGTYAHSNS